MKKGLLLFGLICIISSSLHFSLSAFSKACKLSAGNEYNANNNSFQKDILTMANKTKSIPLDTDKNSITVFVNKEYSLPADYKPEDLVVPDIPFSFSYYAEKKLMRKEAAAALEKLFAAAQKENLSLYGVSAYRSYDRQKQIYETNIQTKGSAYTNRYSAKPGFSEHQTGLAIDVSTPSISNHLEPIFAYTPEGKWLAKNAHLYGFILRYPKGKEHLTGYSYEPWHIRYVGKKLACYLYENDLILEEYYHYTLDPSFQNDISYDSKTEVDRSHQKTELKQPSKKEIEQVQQEDDVKKEPAKPTKKEDVKKPPKPEKEEETSSETDLPPTASTDTPSQEEEESSSDAQPADTDTDTDIDTDFSIDTPVEGTQAKDFVSPTNFN